MNTEELDTPEAETPGSRLRDYIDARWGRKDGGILGLARRLNTSTETMYAWFRNDYEPSLDHLTRLAKELGGVSRSEIVAVMDGEEPALRLSSSNLAALDAAIDRKLDEDRLDEALDAQRTVPGSAEADRSCQDRVRAASASANGLSVTTSSWQRRVRCPKCCSDGRTSS